MLLSIALLLAPPPAPVQPPKWTVDFADDHCRASRAVEVGGKPATLSIRPPLDGGSTRITVSSVIVNRHNIEPVGAIDFGDGLPPFKTPMLPALFDQGMGSLFELPANEAKRLRHARAMTIRTGGVTRGRFDLPDGAALFRTLDRCVADLRKRVGLDGGAVPWSQPARAPADLGRQFSSTRYWTVETREARSNRVTVRLLVDRAGDVRECSVLHGTGSPGLDVQTCQVFERKVRYSPALNAAGKSVASVVTETVKWRR